MAQSLIVAMFDTSALADAAECDLQNDGISFSMIQRYQPGDAGRPTIRSEKNLEALLFPVEFLSWLIEGNTSDCEASDIDDKLSIILTVDTIDNLQCAEVLHILEGHSPREIEIQERLETIDLSVFLPQTSAPVVAKVKRHRKRKNVKTKDKA